MRMQLYSKVAMFTDHLDGMRATYAVMDAESGRIENVRVLPRDVAEEMKAMWEKAGAERL